MEPSFATRSPKGLAPGSSAFALLGSRARVGILQGRFLLIAFPWGVSYPQTNMAAHCHRLVAVEYAQTAGPCDIEQSLSSMHVSIEVWQ